MAGNHIATIPAQTHAPTRREVSCFMGLKLLRKPKRSAGADLRSVRGVAQFQRPRES